MATALKLCDSEIDVDVSFAAAGLPFVHAQMQQLDKLVRAWFAGVAVNELVFTESATAGVWRYEFTHADGRRWRQRISFGAESPDSDPLMDFAGDAWRVSEFHGQRDVRAQLVKLHCEYGLIHARVMRP